MELRLIDLRTRVALPKVFNRRFMFNPLTQELLLGGDDISVSSHAVEWEEAGAKGRFDDAVRGWVGRGRGYAQGVIHFAPEVLSNHGVKKIAAGFDVIEYFHACGFGANMVLRNFIKRGEHLFKE